MASCSPWLTRAHITKRHLNRCSSFWQGRFVEYAKARQIQTLTFKSTFRTCHVTAFARQPRVFITSTKRAFSSFFDDEGLNDDDGDDDEDKSLSLTALNPFYEQIAPEVGSEGVFVIQPVADNEESQLTTPQLQLAESAALVESLPDWNVVGHHVEKLKKMKSRLVFPQKVLDRLIEKVKKTSHVSSVFISFEQLSPNERQMYKNLFGVDKIYDRYSLVLQIFKLRAQTKQAKLQVELAEIPYQKKGLQLQALEEGPDRQKQGFFVESYQNQLRKAFHRKEQKLRKRLKALSQQRDGYRTYREKSSVPTVAVVGYTNAGKTSLIKALTQAEKIEPKDQLFATLDVTAHTAVLPNKLKYVLVDTVGFLSNLPLTLFDAFSATMEDMLCADVIVHVRDESHPDKSNQLKNVISILSALELRPNLLRNIVEVRNKIDLVHSSSDSIPEVFWPKAKKITLQPGKLDLRPAVVCRVAATRGAGLKSLVAVLQDAIMSLTKRRRVEMIVPAAGPHHEWLRAHCSVEELTGHGDYQFKLIAVVTDAQLAKFTHNFDGVEVLRDLKVERAVA